MFITGETSKKRSAIVVLKDVILALLIREVKTRFGAYRIGFIWALLEPIAHVLMFSVIFGARAREGFGGVETPIFIFTGIVPFLLFQNLFNRCKSAASANKGLFHYRYVKPFAAFIARIILEVMIFVFVACSLLALFWWAGYQVAIEDVLKCFVIILTLVVFASSLGVIAAFLTEFFPESDKVLGIIMKPMLFVSGVFYTLDMIPQQYHVYLIWNPILHAIELFRDAFIDGFESSYVSYPFVFMCAMTSLFIALRLYRSHWTRMVAS
ncbi:ABC transporter permease [Saccharobesus litoralis]|uniref:ABC transporter permease n=1 Tax=Saccharobesus litoralis TaxID=2172099 RepID=UPI00131EE78E|nr:ABC transporter permease [Saccharobesus litoralis]